MQVSKKKNLSEAINGFPPKNTKTQLPFIQQQPQSNAPLIKVFAKGADSIPGDNAVYKQYTNNTHHQKAIIGRKPASGQHNNRAIQEQAKSKVIAAMGNTAGANMGMGAGLG